MKLLLSTSNIMGEGSSIRRSLNTKSNAELISSLRSNFEAHNSLPDQQINGEAKLEDHRADYRTWTHFTEEPQTLELPALDFADTALQEESDAYDITVKLFYLPNETKERREEHTREAVGLVLRELHVPSIDLLIVSFPGIYFDEEEDCPDKISTRGPVEAEPESLERQIDTWSMLEKMVDEGIVKRLGVAEFGKDRLESFLAQGKTRIRPAVNQINLRDCCSVPKPLLILARQSEIELLVHNDCSNILPRGTLRELLGPGSGGARVLAESAKAGDKRKSVHGERPANGTLSSDGVTGEVLPQWVVKYTAVVRNRGVVENKGYFASAEVVAA